jgi:hypothetical protein
MPKTTLVLKKSSLVEAKRYLTTLEHQVQKLPGFRPWGRDCNIPVTQASGLAIDKKDLLSVFANIEKSARRIRETLKKGAVPVTRRSPKH